jgi:hypothetical protein
MADAGMLILLAPLVEFGSVIELPYGPGPQVYDPLSVASRPFPLQS